MSDEKDWNSAITKVEPNHLVTRGYRQEDLIGSVPYSHVVYLLLRGELPSEAHGRLMDAIITASIDHGVTPPSAQASRIVYTGGVPVPTAIAAGLMSIGDSHGGAIENCMVVLQDAVKEGKDAGQVIQGMNDRGMRVPGIGHRVHTNDPRTKKLFALAKELGVAGDHVAMLESIQAEAAKKKPLPINVDGAIAAVASDMGFEPKLGKAFFVMGRVAGLTAHVFEEDQRFKRMRKLFNVNVGYDGPEERDLPDRYRE